MVIGDQGLVGTMYSPNEYGVVLNPGVSMDQFKKMMEETITFLPEGVVTGIGEVEKQLKIEEGIKALGNIADLDPNSYYVQDGKVYQKNEYGMEPDEVPASKRGKVTSYVKIRDTMQQLYAMKRRNPDADATQLLSDLNSEYENFVKNYGALNDKANNNLNDDPGIYKVRALEIYDQATKVAKKADVMSGVTFETDKPTGKSDSIEDAYIQSLNKYGSIDVNFVARQMGIDSNAAADMLIGKGLAYQSAEEFLNGGKTYYVSKEEYLSGNVRKKLQNAVKAQKKDRRFEINVRALEAVIPADLPPENILLQLSNPVLEISDVKDFIQVLLNPHKLTVNHNPFNGKWDIAVKTYNYDAINRDYGIQSYDAIKILRDILSGNDPMVYGTTYDAQSNPTKVFLEQDTAAARVKAKAIKDRFDEWIWSDEDRTQRLVRAFNDRFNAFVDRNYIHPKRIMDPDADIRFINSAFPFPAHKHQSDAVWRQTQSKNVMLAHEVGSGKTLEMIWASQECKRLGLIKKPMFTFPNHMVGQWASEFYQAYPDADLLVAREKDVSANKRQLFVNKVATNNYDAVLIKLQDFGSIKLSPEEEADQLQYVIENFQQYLNDMDSGEKKERSVKDMQKKLDGFKNRINDLKAKSKKDKNTLYFDDMGIDMLFVDEADLFKNLMYYTTLQKVKGLGTATGSGRAMDLSMKIRYIQRKGGRVVFATGTPISNTLVEAYTMMKYLQPEWLHEEGIESFDDWHKMFARTNTDMELDNTGSSYRPTSRFSKITNIPALMSALRQVWDIKTASMLERMKILVPGKNIPYKVIENISAPLTDLMKSFKRYMVRRENEIKRQGKPEKGMDNILTLINDGMKAAVDLRLFNSSLPDLPDSKLNLVVNNVVKIYKQYAKQRYTQVLFLENPRSYKKVNGVKTLDFDAYEDIRAKLIKGGINPDEIADIRDKKYSTSAAKLDLYNELRAGRKRVLLGSVKKMGAGTNIQTLGKAIHQIDAKWKPRDFDQSNGRFVRQGNTVQDWDGDNIVTKGKIGTVTIYNYVTKGSLDSGLWAMLETKSKVIKAIMENEGGIFEVEEDYFGSAKELSIEDPVMKEAMTLRNRVKELNGIRKAWVMNKNRLEQDIKSIPSRIKQINTSIAKAEKDIATRTEEKKGDDFEITLAKSVEEPGVMITFKKEEKKKGEEKKEKTDKEKTKEKTPRQLAGEHIISLINNGWDKTNKRASIGQYAGFPIYLDSRANVRYQTSGMGTSQYGIEAVGGYKYSSSTSMDTPNPAALLTYLHKAIYEHPENHVTRFKAEIKALELSLGEAKKRVDKPFQEKSELEAAEARITEVDTILSSRKDETVDLADEPVNWENLRIELGVDLSGKSEEIMDEDEDGGDDGDVETLQSRELIDGGPQLFTNSLDDLKKRISPELWDVFDVTVSTRYGKGGKYSFDTDSGVNKVNGSVWYDENGFHVVLNPKADPDKLSKTLVHEVMGHVGATNVLIQNKGIHRRLKQLFLQSQKTPLVMRIRTNYKEELKNRPDRAEDIVFSEWIAHNMDSYISNPQQQGIVKQVWLAIRKFLIDLGFLPHNINDMMYAIAKDMKTLTGVKIKLAAALEAQNERRLSKPIIGDKWYSPTLKAAQELKQVKGTGDQMFNMITKTPGVKEAEWKWIGLDDFLKRKQSVTRQEIEDFVRQNQVAIKETQIGGATESDIDTFMEDEAGQGMTREEAREYLSNDDGVAKYASYTLPGGENYREVLLTLPGKGDFLTPKEREEYNKLTAQRDRLSKPEYFEASPAGDRLAELAERAHKSNKDNFKSSHWDEPNVIAHIRTNDRTGPNGEKILFVEEIQSDWAREARAQGAGELTEFPEGYTTRYRDSDKKIVLFKNNEIVDSFKDYDAALQYLNKNRKPAQPFLKNWEELTLKRVLRMAAEEKYDRVAWINGKQTADRYDLSQKVSHVYVTELGENQINLVIADKDKKVIMDEEIKPTELSKYIGKDVATKIMKQVPENGMRKLSGVDLEIGGEWAQNLYDRVIPNFMNKFGKKWGARVENISVLTGKPIDSEVFVQEMDGGGYRVIARDGEVEELFTEYSSAEAYAEQLNKGRSENTGQQSIPITDPMRESVLYEGMPLFSKELSEEEEKSLLESEPDESYYEDEGRHLEAIYNRVAQPDYHVSKSYRKTKDAVIADLLTPITTRLKNLSPNVVTTSYGQVGSFKEAMKRFEFDWMIAQQNDMKQVQSFLDAVSKMDPADQKILDMAFKNADDAKVAELIAKYNLRTEYRKVRSTLDDIHRRAQEAGFNLKYIKEYWPKKVLNYGKLVEYAAGTVEGGVLLKQITKAENMLKRPLTDKEKADIINMFIARPDRIISIPGATKKRTIKFIDTEMDKFYDFSTSALVGYVHDMNQQIGIRKFLGMDKEARAEEALKESRMMTMDDVLDMVDDVVDNKIGDITAGIDKFVLAALNENKLNPQQQDELIGLLRARFNYRPAGQIVQTIKDVGVIAAMGSGFNSFITQLMDFAGSYYTAGPQYATQALWQVLKKENQISLKNIGIDRIAEEFRTQKGLSKYVSMIFDKTFLTLFDKIGKETLGTATFLKYQSLARKKDPEFTRYISAIFGTDKSQQVLDDLDAGNLTMDVQYLAFSKILDFQPGTTSEMTMMYVNSPRSRIFYSLKTYTIKFIDTMRNEGIAIIQEGVRTGNRAMVEQGLRNLAMLVALYSLAGAGTDALKDLIFGRAISFKDAVIDNALRLIGISRYIAWEARKDGIPMALTKIVMPAAANLVEAPMRDMWSLIKQDDKPVGEKIRDMETLGMVPFVGKHYYWRYGGGRQKVIKREGKAFGDDYAEFNKMANRVEAIRKHYKTLKGEDRAKYRSDHIKELSLTNPNKEGSNGQMTTTINKWQADIKKMKDKYNKAVEIGDKEAAATHKRNIKIKAAELRSKLKKKL
jgi:N12 class adenine-specific DNA methylase